MTSKMGNKYRKIYIAHRYGDRDHYKALYDCAKKYGFEVEEQIILRMRPFLGKMLRSIKQGMLRQALRYLIVRIKFYFLEDEILIVSLAPYDDSLIKYKSIFKRNQSFFHTSHPIWDGSDFPFGHVENKQIFEGILATCFNAAFCVNVQASKGLEPFIENRVVVGHSINTKNYRHNSSFLGKQSDARKCVFVGQLINRKNINWILTWFLDNKDEKITIDFIGDGSLREDVKKASLNDHRIKFLGKYTKHELQESLYKYDYLLLPSSAEPFGIVLIEGLASGVVCIASNVSGPNDIITDGRNGFLFDIENGYDSFAQTMNKIMEIDNYTLSKMKENAVNDARKYDSRVVIDKWMSILKDC